MTVSAQRFVGGMNLDRRLGKLRRANATVPLAVMTICAAGLSIEPIRLLARVLPGLHLSRQQVQTVFRSRGVLTPGVAVRESTGVHYFWTLRGRRIVAELQALGYPTEPPQRPPLWPLLGWSDKPIT